MTMSKRVLEEDKQDIFMEKIATVQAQAYEGSESMEEMHSKLKVVNERADVVAQRIPMLFGKEEDEMRQICHFILRYYEPVLSLLERQQIEGTMKGSVDEIRAEKLRKEQDQEKQEKEKQSKARKL